MAEERDELTVVNDQWVSPTYTVDLSRAIGMLLRIPARGLFHVVNSGSCTWYQFARTIVKLTGCRSTVIPISSCQLNRPAAFGCRNVMVLDGGLAKWRSGNFPLTDDPGITRPSACTVEMQLDFLVGYEECRRLKDEQDAILLDTRPYLFYAGQGPWPKPGHIPGAVSVPAAQLMHDHNSTLLKPEDEIRGILSS